MDDGSAAVTAALADLRYGNAEAWSELVPLIYDDLGRIAASYLSHERRNHTLQPTALVHETYLRLMQQREPRWRDRNHFFGVAAHLMRLILVDYARAHNRRKRVLETGVWIDVFNDGPAPLNMEHLDDALNRLAELNPRQSRIVELRYFGGLTIDEIADALDISPRTVKRDWTVARTWLHAELQRMK